MEHLPEEILLHLFSFFKQEDLIYLLRNVCSQWRQMSSHPSLWKSYTLNAAFNHPPLYHIQSLKIVNSEILTHPLFTNPFGSIPCSIGETYLDQLIDHSPRLKEISVYQSSIPPETLFHLLQRSSPGLTTLSLNAVHYITDDFILRLTEINSTLKKLNLKRVPITNVGVHCLCTHYSLTHLSLPGNTLTNDSIARISQSCSQLQSLQLYSINNEITDINPLARLTNLRCLQLRDVKNIVSYELVFSKLCHLIHIEVYRLTKKSFQILLSKYPFLHTLKIRKCNHLYPIENLFYKCPLLKTVKICYRTFDFISPHHLKIKMGRCTQMTTDFFVNLLSKYTPTITSLYFVSNEWFPQNFIHLKKLNLFITKLLPSETFRQIASNCSQLEDLNLEINQQNYGPCLLPLLTLPLLKSISMKSQLQILVLKEILKKCIHLQHFSYISNKNEEELYHLCQIRGNTLLSLKYYGSEVSNDSFQYLDFCQQIRYLDIINCVNITSFKKIPPLPTLKKLQISYTPGGHLNDIFFKVPNLKHLVMEYREIDDFNLLFLSQACPFLHSLFLHGCGKLSHLGLEYIITNCLWLKKIVIQSDCVLDQDFYNFISVSRPYLRLRYHYLPTSYLKEYYIYSPNLMCGLI